MRRRTPRHAALALPFLLALVSTLGADEPGPAPAPTAPAPTAPAPALRTLDRAVADGLLEVRGEAAAGYSSVQLVLRSKASAPILVDLAGRHLRPTTGDVQRLGLSFPTTPSLVRADAPPGTWPVEIGPGATVEVRLHSCCMDAGKACPRPTDRFVLAANPPPPVVEAALRWWVDHPATPQGVVNAAIWQADLGVLTRVRPGQDGGGAPIGPRGRFARSHRGVLYLLDDGALTSLDREGVRRFHATGIHAVFPVDGGLLAVGEGASGRELWRFGDTGDPPWVRLFPLGDEIPSSLVAAPRGAYLWAGARGVAWRGPGAGPLRLLAFEDRAPPVDRVELGVLDAAKGRCVAVVFRKGQGRLGSSPANVRERSARIDLYDLDARDAEPRLRKRFWNVAAFAAGPAGVFALTPAGRIERLDGERLVPVPTAGEWSSLLAVGASRLLLRSTAGGLFALDLPSARATPLPAGADAVALDPITDDVVWIAADAAQRWSGPDAPPEAIPLR